MFFGLDVPFILNELESKKELREYFKISEVLTADQVYKIFSQQNPENLLKALNRILNHQNRVKRRGKIEDFFKLLKQGLNLKEIHKYTPESIQKTVYLNVFLGALIISQGFNSKTAIQQLSEN